MENSKKVKFRELEKSIELPYLHGREYYFNRNIDVKYYIGDVFFTELNLDELHDNCPMIVINGNLQVENYIINTNCNDGIVLVVLGEVFAKILIAGGSEIYIEGTAAISEFVLAFYNDGILTINKLITKLYINDDHYTEINDDSAIKHDYDDIYMTDYLETFFIDDVLEKEVDGKDTYIHLNEDILFQYIFQKKNFLKSKE